mmetsp:Transcript_5059/g.11040  ORF Transcript_5059/g.11040 Transcript_5059/m.11040 type:complete len:1146 (-) Transcript_5059:375-3812(-)
MSELEATDPTGGSEDAFTTTDQEQIRRRQMSRRQSLFTSGGDKPDGERRNSKRKSSINPLAGFQASQASALQASKWNLVRSRIKAALFKGSNLAAFSNNGADVVSLEGKKSGQIHPILFLLPDGSHRTLRVDFGLSGNDLKKIVLDTILKGDRDTFGSVDSFVFLHEQSSEELSDEQMTAPLRSLPALMRDLIEGEVGPEEDMVLTGDAPALRVVAVEEDPLREHRVCCEKLVGRSSSDGEEVRLFRKAVKKEMVHLMKALEDAGDKAEGSDDMSESDTEGLYGIADETYPIYLSTTPLPSNVTSQQKVLFKVALADDVNASSKGLMVEQSTPADDLISSALKKFKLSEEKSFTLKVPGFKEYVHGPNGVIDFDYVRRCVKKKSPVELVLMETATAVTSRRSHALSEVQRSSVLGWKRMRGPTDGRLSSRSVILTHMIDREFFVRVKGVDFDGDFAASMYERMKPQKSDEVAHWEMELSLHYGGVLLCPVCSTPAVGMSQNPRWEFNVDTGVKVSDLPLETRLCITLCKRAAYKAPQPVASVTVELFDYRNRLRSGILALRMWMSGERANPLGPAGENSVDKGPPVVVLDFPSFNEAIFAQPHDAGLPAVGERGHDDKLLQPNVEERTKLLSLIHKDPLYVLVDEEKAELWKFRYWLRSYSRALPKFLVSVQWHRPKEAREARALLHMWQRPKAAEALELLDSRFADQTIRDYAVECLNDMEDIDVAQYALQLVQALKYERNLENSLSLFIVNRAVSSRIVGQTVFWNLKAELHSPVVKERFSVLCEEFLKYAGATREELVNQHEVLSIVHDIAMKVKSVKKEERTTFLVDAFSKVKLPPRFGLPLDPRLECCGLLADKTKAFDSKKVPVRLVFSNADMQGSDNYVIYKAGDDLRQDALTLQLIRLMDRLWQKEGLDLCLKPYATVSTGDDQGMLEVVMHSETIANIQKADGGIRGAFKLEPIKKWFDANRPQSITEEEQREVFMKSLAGYCVATYVLGIGDRHNDNIMVTKFGHFFHIDFGHFLGNIKKKFGVKRERAPFVFTPDLAFAMGGKKSKKYAEFEELCCKAYNILRRHAHVFINLFSLMLSTGMPELKKPSDIDYLRDAFSLSLNEQEAASKFKALIDESLNCKTTLVNFAIHNLVH